MLLWSAYACAAAAWVIALLGLARYRLARPSGALARASEMAYPFYVLHHGFIVAVAYAVVSSQTSLARQFLVVASVSLLATVGLCGIIASSPALRVLFGLHAQRGPRASYERL